MTQQEFVSSTENMTRFEEYHSEHRRLLYTFQYRAHGGIYPELIRNWYKAWTDSERRRFVNEMVTWIREWKGWRAIQDMHFVRDLILYLGIRAEELKSALLEYLKREKFFYEHFEEYKKRLAMKKKERDKLLVDRSVPSFPDMLRKGIVITALSYWCSCDSMLKGELINVIERDFEYGLSRYHEKMKIGDHYLACWFLNPLRELLEPYLMIETCRAIPYVVEHFDHEIWEMEERNFPNSRKKNNRGGVFTRYRRTGVVWQLIAGDAILLSEVAPYRFFVREDFILLVDDTIKANSMRTKSRYKTEKEEVELRKQFLEKFVNHSEEKKRILMALLEIGALKWRGLPPLLRNVCLVPYSYQKEEVREILRKAAEQLRLGDYKPPEMLSFSECEYEHERRILNKTLDGWIPKMFIKYVLGRDCDEWVKEFVDKKRGTEEASTKGIRLNWIKPEYE